MESFEWFKSSNISKLAKLAEEKTPCYVWGMSAYMQLLIAKTPLGKCNIISFLDKSEYKQTKTINKIPIKSPEILKNLSNETIVIFPAEPYGNSMVKYLKEINFSGKKYII